VVLFKSRLPVEFLPLPWKGDKVIRHAAGSERLLRFERGPATLGGERWDKLPTYVLDASTEGYPPEIDGVLGVLALGAVRVRFDFERGKLWHEVDRFASSVRGRERTGSVLSCLPRPSRRRNCHPCVRNGFAAGKTKEQRDTGGTSRRRAPRVGHNWLTA
jgi:hypothetical protein